MTNSSESDRQLTVDDLVTMSDLIEAVIGRALAPQESSRLKTAYHRAQREGTATIATITQAAADADANNIARES
ncbi:hypothetical protein [Mycolicibacterium sp.]|uniref:hypothetical protein n=1 Tax=Mycolicibacterium sp. TaxID=2320850 RepID=UPI0037C7B8F5